MSIIEVEAVSKTFSVPSVRRDTIREHVLDLFRPRQADLLPILQRVSFTVQRGETVGIVGRNGSGKSTLLKIVAGIYRPDGGRVTVLGAVTPILELGLGWNPELDAIDNIFIIGAVMGLSLREIRGAIDEILAFAELERFANLKLQHYSSGMGARLAYSIAFKAVREILILDEIFAVGDASFQERCKERYRELRAAGHTVLIVSHDRPVIAGFCDRALLLERGHIIMDDSAVRVCDTYDDLLHGVERHELVPAGS
jgi:ABC-type polysaccharide/polyol phosphate transport system ATPase subunit